MATDAPRFPSEDSTPSGLRLAELIAALSLATDLGMGQPMAHALRTCLIATAIGRVLDLPDGVLADTYYTALLRFVGCTSDSHELLAFTGGEDVEFRRMLARVGNGSFEEVAPPLTSFLASAGVTGRVDEIVHRALTSREGIAARSMTAHCEVASALASRLGFDPPVCDALRHGFERWDGHGFPDGWSGEEIPVAVRLAVLARDVEVLSRTRGLDATRVLLRQRRGRAHDPRAVDAFLGHDADILREIDAGDPWTEVLRREPGGARVLGADRVDDTLTAFADFADLKTPFTIGHSREVARLCDRAARSLGLSPQEVEQTRQAALVHDLGRAGVSNVVWEHPGPLSMNHWERVRLHAYYSERVLGCCAFLRPLGALAGAHHERLDGSGYHRGVRGTDLATPMRLLAAADACQAMMQTRPHRPAMTLADTARTLRREASDGRLDARMVDAVLAAAGAPAAPTRRAWPMGLTDREVQVLRLVANGASNREVSAALGITPKTAGHHVQHIYDKTGCSTRAAAALFAVQHGLL